MMMLEFLFSLVGTLMVGGGILVAGMGALSVGPFAAVGLVAGIAIGSGAFLAGLTLLWCALVLRMLAFNKLLGQCVVALERQGTLLGRCVAALERQSPAPIDLGSGSVPPGPPIAGSPPPPLSPVRSRADGAAR